MRKIFHCLTLTFDSLIRFRSKIHCLRLNLDIFHFQHFSFYNIFMKTYRGFFDDYRVVQKNFLWPWVLLCIKKRYWWNNRCFCYWSKNAKCWPKAMCRFVCRFSLLLYFPYCSPSLFPNRFISPTPDFCTSASKWHYCKRLSWSYLYIVQSKVSED